MTRDDETESLRRRLRGGETVGAFWFALGSPALVEMACEAAPDVLVLDAQHGLWHRPSLEHAIGMVAGRQPVLVRTADASPRSIGEALDAGAEGVLVPMIETAEQAAEVVAAARFPPDGRRSAGGGSSPPAASTSDSSARRSASSSRSRAASSNRRSSAAASISCSRSTIIRSSSAALTAPGSSRRRVAPRRPVDGLSFRPRSSTMSVTPFTIVRGVMPCSSL